MRTYQNIRQLCRDMGADNFWLFGRNLYKYTGCGPWVSLVLTEDRTVYYEDKGTDDRTLLDDPDIIGIKIGSIVKGSDVEVGPEFLRFPFSNEDFNATVKEIDSQARFYWDRDNVDTYLVRSSSGKDYCVDVGPFGPPRATPPGKVPSTTLARFRRWLTARGGEPLEEGESESIPLNNKGLEIRITRMEKSDFIY